MPKLTLYFVPNNLQFGFRLVCLLYLVASDDLCFSVYHAVGIILLSINIIMQTRQISNLTVKTNPYLSSVTASNQ
jgi:hypothetical protein